MKTTFKSNVAPVSQTWDMHVSHCNCSCIRFIAPDINPLPFFSPLIFSPLPDLLLLFVCCCLECHLILFLHPLLCYLLMPVVLIFSFLHTMDIMTGLLIAAVIFQFYSFFIWTLLLSFCSSLCSSLFPILDYVLHVLSLNLWFVLFICFISLFV